MYIYIYTHMHIIYVYIYIYIYIHMYNTCIYLNHKSTPKPYRMQAERFLGKQAVLGCSYYTRSPLEDSRLFGPSPWKILSHYL